MKCGGQEVLLLCLGLLFSCALPLAAQDDEEIITLPAAEIVEPADTPNVVTREEMERENVRDLWQAVRNVPGVILSGGGQRNDSGISVRGFDSASMPVFVDGVTQANPYRGDNDAARILTGDMESVTIEKGFSTLLLGPNTMGGAIIIRTARPREPFEASFMTSAGFDSLGKAANTYHTASLGTKAALFYGKAVFQYRDTDHFRIPYDFEPKPNNPQQKGERLWSESNDIKLTLLAGWTPVDNMDFSVSWIYQDSYKGFSPPSVNGRDYQIWEWPYYRRQGITFSGEWLPSPFMVKASGYFQKFDNRLLDYVNWASYEAGIPTPASDYDDFTAGFHLEAAWDVNPWNRLEAAVNFREDDHRGLTGDSLGVHITEDTWSLAAAYTVRIVPPLRATAAAGLDMLVPAEFWGKNNEMYRDEPSVYIEKSNSWKLVTAEAGLFYEAGFNHEIRLTYARKNHFPTMFQRYSTRIGEIKPNPNLAPEWADHFEAGYRGSPLAALNETAAAFILDAAVYYSLVTQKIVDIQIPKPDFTAVTIPYSVNLDSTAVWGLEAALEWELSGVLSAGATLSLNRYEIIKTSNGVKALALYPSLTASAYAVLQPVPGISVIPSLHYIGSRWTNTAATAELDGYFLLNLKAVYDFNSHLSVSAAVENMFDTLYEIRPYFPQPGRSYTVSFTAQY